MGTQNSTGTKLANSYKNCNFCVGFGGWKDVKFTITVTFGREPGKYFNMFVKIEQIFAISTCTVCAHVASTLHLLDYPHSLSTLGYNLLTCDYCESKSVQSKIINLTGLVDLFKPWD